MKNKDIQTILSDVLPSKNASELVGRLLTEKETNSVSGAGPDCGGSGGYEQSGGGSYTQNGGWYSQDGGTYDMTCAPQ